MTHPKQQLEPFSPAEKAFVPYRSFCQVLLLLFFAMILTVQADDQPAVRPYPWEKEGPAVREFELQPIATPPGLLMGALDIAEVIARNFHS